MMSADRADATGRKPPPRTYLRDPRLFGKAPVHQIKLAGDFWGPAAGAWEQHQLAYRARQFAAENHLKLLDFASRSGIEYQRLCRVLRGAAWMTMEDLGRLDEVIPQILEGSEPSPVGEAAEPSLAGDQWQSRYSDEEWPPER